MLAFLLLISAVFRQYDDPTKQFYKENHENQTLQFVLEKKAEYLPLRKTTMSIWDAVAFLDTLVDESDPDLHLPQSYHAYQTAEALRKDGHPRWLVLAGFIHDLGKVLALWNEPQWAVVGDTFPVGCAFSDKIIFPEFFAKNPDQGTYDKLGIYEKSCGLNQVHMSWGHDEYLYQVIKDYVCEEAAYIVRYHSFYPAHREGEYSHLMDEKDVEMMEWVRLFNNYDLYSKSEEEMDCSLLEPYYRELVNEFFPQNIQW